MSPPATGFNIVLNFREMGFELSMAPIFVARQHIDGHYYVGAYSQSLLLTCVRGFADPVDLDVAEGVLAACPFLLGTFLAEEPHEVYYWRRAGITEILPVRPGDLYQPDLHFIENAELAHNRMTAHWLEAGHSAVSIQTYLRDADLGVPLGWGITGEA